ncbi:MAG: hypoxanthine-guanine phosphoribosyltransferase [Gammaproteobacteria bacterium]|nr:MAG: hypoxanthine-guanine phosphoribosyltransferase [Gammaproteobacteria bacterium]
MSDIIPHMTQVLQEADCLATEEQVEQAIDTMAGAITDTLSNSDPLLLCTMNGGLILTAKLLSRLRFPLQVDYIHATRYRNETTAGDMHWRAMPEQSLEQRNVLIIDDILDVGVTLAGIIAYCRSAGVQSVRSAVLVDKIHNRKFDKSLQADFCGLYIEDRYLFGCGMDYRGYWRNVPGIYAVKGH